MKRVKYLAWISWFMTGDQYILSVWRRGVAWTGKTAVDVQLTVAAAGVADGIVIAGTDGTAHLTAQIPIVQQPRSTFSGIRSIRDVHDVRGIKTTHLSRASVNAWTHSR